MRRVAQLSLLTVVAVSLWVTLSGVVRALDLTDPCGTLVPGCGIVWWPSLTMAAIIAYGQDLLGIAGTGLVLALAVQIWRHGDGARALRPFALGSVGALAAGRLVAGAAPWLGLPPIVEQSLSPPIALILLGILLALHWRLPGPNIAIVGAATPIGVAIDRPPRRLVAAVVIALLVVIGTGAVVGMDGAALPCTSWPLCVGDQWLPTELTLAGGLHLVHRVVSAVAAVLVGALLVAVWIGPRDVAVRRTATAIAALMISQILLGGDFVVGNGPALLGVLHVLAALALWMLAMRLVVLVNSPSARAIGSWPSRRPNLVRGRLPASPVPAPVLAFSQAAPALPVSPPIGIALPSGAAIRQVAADYVALTKPGILSLLLFTTFAAMLIAAAGLPSFWLICITIIGGTLAAGGANVLNCYIDRDIDAQMTRTRHRATAAERIPPSHALWFGITLTGSAVLVLGWGANWLAAALALAGNLFYVFVYTLWLKRRTPQNIVIGGAAGAVPPLVGWAAVTGDLSAIPWLLFAIVFMWTPPHFWSLALLKQGEYGRALVPMLPVVAGEAVTRRQILLYSGLLFLVCLGLAPAGLGALYLVATATINGVFLAGAVLLYCRPTKRHARQLFFFSLWYLVLVFGAAVLDRLLLG